MVVVRALTVEQWAEWRSLRLAALEEAPLAFGARLADWRGGGDVEHRWRDRLSDFPLNLVADLDGSPVGMVSATHPDHDGVAELLSMWVAPVARGRGVGDALISAVVRWAAQRGATSLALRVVEGNDRAMTLYRRHGFVDAGRVERARPDRLAEREMRLVIP